MLDRPQEVGFVLSVSKLSNPFGKMPLQVCERNLARLLSWFAEYPDHPDPESTDLGDLSGRTKMEIARLFEGCIIERHARQLQLLLKEIYREVDCMEQAAVLRYPPYTRRRFHTHLLPERRFPDHWLRIRDELDEEFRQQYPECLRLSCVSVSRVNSFDDSANPILDGAFLDLKRCFPKLDLYCDPADSPPLVTDRYTGEKIVITAAGGWETCIAVIVQAFLARTTLPPRLVLPTEKNISSSRRRGRVPDTLVKHRTKLIQAVADMGLTGEAYCKALAARLETPISWQRNENCPKSYVEAWNDPSGKWRSRIDDERRNACVRKKSSRR
jgi:hypothetical protein